MLKTAVVILNWNGEAMLRRFLPTLIRCTDLPDTALYVADNGSTDNSISLIKNDFPAIRILPLGRNHGFAEGYNLAIAQVEARYVVLLNSDVEVTSGWLRPLVHHLDTHPGCAACQPKLLSLKQKDHFEYAGAAGGYLDRLGYPLCRGRLLSTVEADHGQYDRPATLLWATGAALCMRRADYLEAGGLDPRFFAHMEEIDLCWRLRARGRDISCVPQSRVYHLGAATLHRDSPRKTFLNFRNNLLMLYKNLPASRLRPVLRARAMLDLMAALHYLLLLQPRNAWAVARAWRSYKTLRPGFRADRERNLRLATQPLPTGILPLSLLWQYYVRRRKRFSDLPAIGQE